MFEYILYYLLTCGFVMTYFIQVNEEILNDNYVKFQNKDLDALAFLRGVDPEVSNASYKFSQQGLKILVVSDEAAGQLKDNLDYTTSNRKQVFQQYDEIILNPDHSI